MSFEFLNEINEARMYRRVSSITGKSVNEIASKFFSHMVAVRVLFHENKSACEDYMAKVVEYPQFEDFKANSPDLYNIIVLMINQYKHADKVLNNWDIKLPEMRLRRILRSLGNGVLDAKDFDGFMIIAQQQIPELSSVQKTLRRTVADYHKFNDTQRKGFVRKLLNDMRESGIQSDLWILLLKTAEENGL